MCNKKELSPYSVLMSVYKKESAAFLEASLMSMVTQTQPPEQIVLVEDGPLTQELDTAIASFQNKYSELLTLVTLPMNMGLGYALSTGIKACRNEIIARMDSDDYSFPNRMEEELKLMESQQLDMVGSQVTEFVKNPMEPISESNLPISQKDILMFSKRRNPFRHPSIVFKKSKVLAVGNYSSQYLYFEDWDLWNRMLDAGYKVSNIDKPLVAMRVSPNFYERRGGLEYAKYIWNFKYSQLKCGYFTLSQFIKTTIPHICVCLAPNALRSFVYNKLLRKGVGQ